MSNIGEIKYGREIGGRSFNSRNIKFIWHACVDCGKERWVCFIKGEAVNMRCRHCAHSGEQSSQWEGGRQRSPDGYIGIKLFSDDFFYPMADTNGYVPEHRLVMARLLGRCLQPWELVHHKGIRYIDIRNKSDNLEDNLELTTKGSHMIEHSKGYRDGYTKGLVDGRDKQIGELRQQIRLLQWQVKQIAEGERI